MLYRFMRALAESFPFACFAVFVVAFFTALAFTVIYPIVPLFLLMISIFLLVGFVVVARILRWLERAAARRGLRNNRCPACAEPIESYRIGNEEVRECVRCQRVFRVDGETWQPDPDQPDAVSSDRSRDPIDSERSTLTAQ